MLVLDKSWMVCYNHATHTNILVIAKDVENTKLYSRWNVFILAYCGLKISTRRSFVLCITWLA